MSESGSVAAEALQVVELGGGLATTALAERHGVSRAQLARLVKTGVLDRVAQGVYSLSGAVDPHQHRRAAWLTLAPSTLPEERLRDPIPTGVISHTSAAAMHGLGDLLDDAPEITVATRKQSRRGTKLHRRNLSTSDVMIVDSLPVTTPERTIADLLRAGHDEGHVVDIVRSGAAQGLLDPKGLAQQLDPIASRLGEPDGQHLAERLLDLSGLSTRALAAAVSGTPIGDAIRYSAIADLMSAVSVPAAIEMRQALTNLVGATGTLSEAARAAMMAAAPDLAQFNAGTLAAVRAALPKHRTVPEVSKIADATERDQTGADTDS